MPIVKLSAIILLMISVCIVYTLMKVSSTKLPKIRKVAALDAIDETIGRCVEMGRPLHFTLGGYGSLYDTRSSGILAGLSILSYVAETSAKKGARLIVTCMQPEVFPVTQEVVRTAFIAEQKPEEFTPQTVRFLGGTQLAYASGIMGIMQRERPAGSMPIGSYGAECMIILESATTVGAMQVGGNCEPGAQPFFNAAADYALICEEIFAAGAYLSKDPLLTRTIIGEDFVKILCIAIIVVGVVLMSLGVNIGAIL
jgi:hypothetical protein